MVVFPLAKGSFTVLFMAAQQQPVLRDWLEKQADWLMTWRPRYFSLQGPVLSYREAEHLPDKGTVHVTSLKIEKERQLRVWSERGETWLLRAATDEAHERWGAALLRATTASTGEALGTTLLRAAVEKRSYWRQAWNARHVTIDGVELAYRDSEGGALRGRFTVVQMDRVDDDGRGRELRVTASSGEAFHMRLESSVVATAWFDVVRQSLSGTALCRWQELQPTLPTREAMHLLRCSNMVLAGGGADDVFLFGGQTATMPGASMQRPARCNGTTRVSLLGDMEVTTDAVAAFEQGEHAKLVPPARDLHASAVLDGIMYVHGGRGAHAVLDNIWSATIGSGADRSWTTQTLDARSSPLPVRCGHSMTVAGDKLLVAGGYDADGELTAACHLFWPSAFTASAFPALPAPRARHGAAVRDDGATLLVGGDGAGSSDAFVFLPAGGTQWSLPRVNLVEGHAAEEERAEVLPCPSFGVAPVVVVSGNTWIILSDCGATEASGVTATSGGAVQLFTAVVDESALGSGPVVELRRLAFTGDTPVSVSGTSGHIAGEHLYLFGDASLPPRSSGMRRIMLPPLVTAVADCKAAAPPASQ
jgi:hypothetical protein